MVTITNRDDLESWFEGKPREVLVAIAARSALRVTPMLVLAEIKSFETDLFLSVLRSTASAVAYGVEPADAVSQAAANAATATYAYATTAAAARSAAAAAATANARATPVTATYATAAAARSAAAYATTIWEAVSADCSALEVETSAAGLIATPLWPEDRVPDWFTLHWARLKNRLNKNADGHCQVWIDWWEARRDGKPYHIEMEREIVLIPSDDWKQGPTHINPMIAAIRARYDASVSSGSNSLPAALASDMAEVSIADYGFEDIARLIQMIPFEGEAARADHPACEAFLSELADAAKDFHTDIKDSNAPRVLSRTVSRYALEAALPAKDVRPGRLWQLGEIMRSASFDPDIIDSLPPLADVQFRQLLDAHLNFMRSVMSLTVARFERVEDVETAPDATPEAIAEALGLGATALDEDVWDQVPEANEEIAAVWRDMQREIVERGRAIQRDSIRAAEDTASLWRLAKVAAGTMYRFALRASEAALKLTGGAAAAKTLWPERFAQALAILHSQFPNIPWPL